MRTDPCLLTSCAGCPTPWSKAFKCGIPIQIEALYRSTTCTNVLHACHPSCRARCNTAACRRSLIPSIRLHVRVPCCPLSLPSPSGSAHRGVLRGPLDGGRRQATGAPPCALQQAQQLHTAGRLGHRDRTPRHAVPHPIGPGRPPPQQCYFLRILCYGSIPYILNWLRCQTQTLPRSVTKFVLLVANPPNTQHRLQYMAHTRNPFQFVVRAEAEAALFRRPVPAAARTCN